jgi:hypothetical protein
MAVTIKAIVVVLISVMAVTIKAIVVALISAMAIEAAIKIMSVLVAEMMGIMVVPAMEKKVVVPAVLVANPRPTRVQSHLVVALLMMDPHSQPPIGLQGAVVTLAPVLKAAIVKALLAPVLKAAIVKAL